MLREFGAFTAKQIANSIFALIIFLALAVSGFVPIPRYDFLLIVCLGAQYFMVRSGLETRRELGLVCLFHLLGLGLELYKVNFGSWSYPEFAYTKFWGVPAYSGFMYASVASYLLQAWRNFDLAFRRMPAPWMAWLGLALVYANFFMNRVWGDWRLLVAVALLAIFGRAYVEYTCSRRRYRMPTLVAFVLIGFFVWVAENLCTYLHAWAYPYQKDEWALVHPMKIASWAMMVIIAFVCVWRWQVREETRAPAPAEARA